MVGVGCNVMAEGVGYNNDDDNGDNDDGNDDDNGNGDGGSGGSDEPEG